MGRAGRFGNGAIEARMLRGFYPQLFANAGRDGGTGPPSRRLHGLCKPQHEPWRPGHLGQNSGEQHGQEQTQARPDDLEVGHLGPMGLFCDGGILLLIVLLR